MQGTSQWCINTEDLWKRCTHASHMIHANALRGGSKIAGDRKMLEICWHLSSFPSLLWHNINMSTSRRPSRHWERWKNECKWQHSSSVSQHAEQPKAEGHATGRGSQTAAHAQRHSFMSFNYAVKSVSSSHEGKHLQGRCWLLYILKSQFIFVAVSHWPCRLSVNETNSWRKPLKSSFFCIARQGNYALC